MKDIHSNNTKHISHQIFIYRVQEKYISHKSATIQTNKGKAGYQMIFARISSNHRSGTKLAGYIPHLELENIKPLGSLGFVTIATSIGLHNTPKHKCTPRRAINNTWLQWGDSTWPRRAVRAKTTALAKKKHTD